MQGAGINPARIQSVLRQASDQQLMMMLRRPDKIPSMFVQQELQRRAAMRQNAKAEQAKMQAPIQRPQQNMNNVSPQNFGRDMNMARQPIGLKHGGMHFSGVDNDPETGMPYAGGIRRDFKRFPNPRSSYQPYAGGVLAKTKFGQAYRPGDVGQPNTGTTIPQGFGIPYTTSKPFISEDMKKTMESGIATKDLIDYDLENVDSGNLIGTGDARQSYDKFDIGPIAKGENPFKDGIKSLDDDKKDIKGSVIGDMSQLYNIKNPNTDISPPDLTAQKNNLTNLETKSKAIFDSMRGEIDKSTTRKETGISDIKSLTDGAIANLKKSQDKRALLFNTDELDSLQKKSREHYQAAIDFIENDKGIAEKQQKLIEAMGENRTPTQRFFGYLAQIGADIMGSDKDNFLEAGGVALSQAMKDYKFDNEKARERYVNSAKLMLEFEYEKRNNKIKAFEMKSNLYGMEIRDWESIQNQKLKNLAEDDAYNTGITTLKQGYITAKENIESGIDANTLKKLGIDQAQLTNMAKITEGLNNIDQTDFNNKLKLAQNNLEVQKLMVSVIPTSAREFAFAQSLPDEARESYMSTITAASKSGYSMKPDDIAKSMMNDQLKRLSKLEESAMFQDDKEGAVKTIFGEEVYNKIKTKDGKVDVSKLYQLYYYNTVSTLLGTGGGSLDNIVDSSDYLQGTN